MILVGLAFHMFFVFIWVMEIFAIRSTPELALFGIIDAAICFVAYTGFCGYFDWCGRNEWWRIYSPDKARNDMFFAVSMAVMPLSIIAASTITNMFRHGFRLRVRQCPTRLIFPDDGLVEKCPYAVTLPYFPSDFGDIIEWCRKNCSGLFGCGRYATPDEFEWRFEHQQDAALFAVFFMMSEQPAALV